MNDLVDFPREVILSASVVCMDPLRYQETVEVLDVHCKDGYHFDLCDGHFAHTLQLSPGLLWALRGLIPR